MRRLRTNESVSGIFVAPDRSAAESELGRIVLFILAALVEEIAGEPPRKLFFYCYGRSIDRRTIDSYPRNAEPKETSITVAIDTFVTVAIARQNSR